MKVNQSIDNVLLEVKQFVILRYRVTIIAHEFEFTLKLNHLKPCLPVRIFFIKIQ